MTPDPSTQPPPPNHPFLTPRFAVYVDGTFLTPEAQAEAGRSFHLMTPGVLWELAKGKYSEVDGHALMSTCLRDARGAEVFDGHLLCGSTRGGRDGVVVWEDRLAGFVLRWGPGTYDTEPIQMVGDRRITGHVLTPEA